jgi:hypothetical protein
MTLERWQRIKGIEFRGINRVVMCKFKGPVPDTIGAGGLYVTLGA